jgi:hypothetical protein
MTGGHLASRLNHKIWLAAAAAEYGGGALKSRVKRLNIAQTAEALEELM